MNKIALLMSGGVDSSVSAILLREMGFDIIGATMKIPGSDCEKSARRVANSLDIPHFTLETEEIFAREVVEKFSSCRKHGMTPNPCADCNRELKFGAVPKMIEKITGIPDIKIATGHYAQIVRKSGLARLARATYKEKDQSYFLCDMPREILDRLIFPLGTLTKAQVREIARKNNLEVAEKPESMDMCFKIPEISDAPGDIVNRKGEILGRHNGISRYTLGQRKGLGIAYSEPLFVLEIDERKNEIIVGTRNDAFTREICARKINVLAPDLLDRKNFFAKTRSKGEPSPCVLICADDENFSVRFDEPQFAPTPGQRLVCYDIETEILVFSGEICRGSDAQ